MAGLPKQFGHWKTIYMRMKPVVQKRVLYRVFEKLQFGQIVRINSKRFF